MSQLVRDLSEEEILAKIVPLLPVADGTIVGPGDDAAVIAAPDGRFVVSVDVLVENHHFRREWSSGADVGARAAIQNLADIAAMGARPTAIVVGLAMPADLPVAWVEDFARGLAQVCAPLGVGVVGGDLSGAEQIMVSVTVHGDLEGRQPVLRCGARAGDVVAHAGNLGQSAAGYAALAAGRDAEFADQTTLFRRPDCPFEAGIAAALAGATAMMDVSDGLIRDSGRIAAASQVAIDLDRDRLQGAVEALSPLAAELNADAWDWVLGGGEDHGILATFPAGAFLPAGFHLIGRVSNGTDVTVDGAPPRVRGWDHFGAE